MRHLGSIVLSLLLAPVIYLLTGVGLVKMSEAQRSLSSVRPVPAAIASAAFLIAGLLYAALVMARLSPLGPVLAGLGFLVLSGWAIGDRTSFLDTVPGDLPGVHEAGWVPAGTFTTLLAVPLVVTVMSPRRWRRWSDRPAAVATSGVDPAGYPGTPYPGAPGYGVPTYQQESTETTGPLPSGPPVWQVRGEPVDPEVTRRLH